jgi:hypothetical protein
MVMQNGQPDAITLGFGFNYILHTFVVDVFLPGSGSLNIWAPPAPQQSRCFCSVSFLPVRYPVSPGGTWGFVNVVTAAQVTWVMKGYFAAFKAFAAFGF